MATARPPQPVTARPGNVPLLDAVRGANALYVVGFHGVELLTPHGPRLAHPHGPAALIAEGNPLGLLGYGHYAVLVFFLLSGYVIHLRQATRPQERQASGFRRWAAAYVRRRARRIYPPLVAALALTFLIDQLGAAIAVEGFPARGPLTWHAAVATLVPLCQPDSFGSNNPLWSLQYELLFYAAYVPLLWWADRCRVRLSRLLVPLAFVGLSVAWVLPIYALPLTVRVLAVYLPLWLAGAVLAEQRVRGVHLRRGGALAALGTAVLVVAALAADNQSGRVDALAGLGLVLVLAAALLRPAGHTARLTVLLAGTAPWSYSLYLVHYPLLALTRAGWLRAGQPLPVHPLAIAAALGVVALVTWGVYRNVESRFLRRCDLPR